MNVMNYESMKVQMAAVGSIAPNPDQPRKYFDQEFINELAKGIKQSGMTEPILVWRTGKDSYEIVKGEQRWRAAKLVGLSEVPILVAKVADRKEAAMIAAISDVLRNGLEFTDLARYLKSLEDDGMSQGEIGKRFGHDQAWVWQRIQVAKHPDILKLMGPEIPPDRRLPLSKALEMAKAPAPDRTKIATMVSRGRLSMGATKSLIAKAKVSRGDCVPKRVRKPVKLFQEFAWMIGQIHEKLKHMVEMPEKEFMEVLSAGKPQQIEEVAKLIKKAAESLDLVEKRVKSVKPLTT